MHGIFAAVGQREKDFDGGAGVVRDDVGLAAVLDGDALDERKPEARSGVFCREKGVEHWVVPREPGAVVFHTEGGLARPAADDDANARTSPPFAGLARIPEQI